MTTTKYARQKKYYDGLKAKGKTEVRLIIPIEIRDEIIAYRDELVNKLKKEKNF